MFCILNLATITRKTSFCHQEIYLQPAIGTIWRDSQNNLLSKLMASGCSLTLAGDRCSDSPKHSAKVWFKFCAGTNIEQIIDLKLVQVCLNNYIIHIYKYFAKQWSKQQQPHRKGGNTTDHRSSTTERVAIGCTGVRQTPSNTEVDERRKPRHKALPWCVACCQRHADYLLTIVYI